MRAWFPAIYPAIRLLYHATTNNIIIQPQRLLRERKRHADKVIVDFECISTVRIENAAHAGTQLFNQLHIAEHTHELARIERTDPLVALTDVCYLNHVPSFR